MTTETTTPNKAHLLQWARALEGGNYKQGQAILKSVDNEFCCLGVACDIAADAVGAEWEIDADSPNHYVFISPDGSAEVAYLPVAVAEWLGVDATGLIINPTLDGSAAVTRNDSLGDSFVEIAAAIRCEFNLPTKEQDEHRLAWIKALESGKYKQGERHLQSADGGFCCLGVACDIARDDIGGDWKDAAPEYGVGVKRYVIGDEPGYGVSYLPIQVAEWFGFTGARARNPELNGVQASDRNDQLHNSFAEIATAAREEFGYPTLEDEINQHRLAWIEALESEDYPQTSGQLKNDYGFCCLGVACEVAKHDVNGEWIVTKVSLGAPAFKAPGDDPRTGLLPIPVAAWLGLNEIDPYLAGKGATYRNDTLGNSFAQIASAAREQFGFPPKA